MDRVAVFVDAGYLFAQGSALVSGERRPRSQVQLDERRAIEALTKFAERRAGLPLLRIYWYDGADGPPTSAHNRLADEANLKLRLGFVNRQGEQKGVDSLIVTDLINLARNRAMSEAVLLSGDEDLRVGVQQAQEFGVRVHLLGIKPSRGSQSLSLIREADSTCEWGVAEVGAFLRCDLDSERPPLLAETPPPIDVVDREPGVLLREAAEGYASELSREDLVVVVEAGEQRALIPKILDSPLLARAGRLLSRDLDSGEKRDLREAFRAACRERLASF